MRRNVAFRVSLTVSDGHSGRSDQALGGISSGSLEVTLGVIRKSARSLENSPNLAIWIDC